MSITLNNKFYTISNIDKNSNIVNISVDVRSGSIDGAVEDKKGFWFLSEDEEGLEQKGYSFLKNREEFAGATDV